MTNHTPHINQRDGLRRTGSILAALLSVAVGAMAGQTAAPTGESAAASRAPAGASQASYGWPVKPFNRQHPIRGYFGDPRTVFAAGASERVLLSGPGDFSYHRGVDISAPNGTPVYPVVSGVVSRVAGELIEVDCGDGLAFEYWHLTSQVSAGDHVTKDQTVLGRIMAGAQHVHLSEVRNGRLVNPLAPGHLGPYRDTTRPTVETITFRRPNASQPLLPYAVSGMVELVAEATDTPPLPVPGMWHGLPVSPAALSYSIRVVKSRRVVVPDTSVMDVRSTLPSGSLWQTYARGSHMNMPQFGQRRFWYQPGVYLFKLTPAPLDTRRLRNDVYELTVTARDTAGNKATATQVFTVQNH